MRFLPITFDGIEIEQWGWPQCASLDEPHRPIRNMTYQGHDVILTFQGQHAYVSTRLNERNMMAFELFR